MSKKQINHFQLSRSWFDFTYEHPELITANHTAMYFFILDHWNRLGWKENFGLPTCMTMEAIGIKSFNTYKKVFKDLVEWEFILLIKKSQNQYSTNVIAVSKIDRSDNKSLDRSLSNHSTNHCSITDNIIVDIDKPNNLKTLKPKNKKEFSEEKKKFSISMKYRNHPPTSDRKTFVMAQPRHCSGSGMVDTQAMRCTPCWKTWPDGQTG